LFVLKLALIFGRCRHGKATWDEKIAAIPIRDIDNVTNAPYMLDIAH
jgi:hypothetical protein